MSFEKKLQESASAILARNLTKKETTEFFRLSTAIGTDTAEDYLFMMLIFKRSADEIDKQLDSFKAEMKTQFDTMGALEKKIDDKLEATIKNMLGKGAEEIARTVGQDIGLEANRTLEKHADFHFVQGQTTNICMTGVLMSIAYQLGAIKLFDNITIPLSFPSGILVFIAIVSYTILGWRNNTNREFSSMFWNLIRGTILIIATVALILNFISKT